MGHRVQGVEFEDSARRHRAARALGRTMSMMVHRARGLSPAVAPKSVECSTCAGTRAIEGRNACLIGCDGCGDCYMLERCPDCRCGR